MALGLEEAEKSKDHSRLHKLQGKATEQKVGNGSKINICSCKWGRNGVCDGGEAAIPIPSGPYHLEKLVGHTILPPSTVKIPHFLFPNPQPILNP